MMACVQIDADMCNTSAIVALNWAAQGSDLRRSEHRGAFRFHISVTKQVQRFPFF
jgi:hypothetical protein